ncbi:MAG: VCBS repeat-containing protein [bacterium]|nr:VCBS repeat-containing protein [bacterium]
MSTTCAMLRLATSSHAVDANGDGQMDIFLVGDAGNTLLINDGESGLERCRHRV